MNWIKPSADYHYLHVGEWFAEMKLLRLGLGPDIHWYGRVCRLLPGKTPSYKWNEVGGTEYVRYFVTSICSSTRNKKSKVRNFLELFVDTQLTIDKDAKS